MHTQNVFLASAKYLVNQGDRSFFIFASMAEQHQTTRGSYTTYKPEQKAMIGRYAAEHGNSKAVQKYTTELGVSVKESTVRQFKKAYFLQLSEGKDPDSIKSIPNKKRGRPSKTGVYHMIKNEEIPASDFPDEVDITSCIAVGSSSSLCLQ